MKKYFIIIRDIFYIATVIPMILYVLLAVFIGVKIVRPPRMKARQTFTEANLAGSPLTLKPSENIALDSWLIGQRGADTVVVVTHELGACKESKFRLARILMELGVSALFFDLRNHGESTYDKNLLNRGDRYTDDIECALLEARSFGYRKIILYAASFSTFPALYVLSRENKDITIDALIMDSGPVHDLRNIIRMYLNAFSKKLLPWVFRGGFSQWFIGEIQTLVAMFLFNVKWPSKDIRSIPKLFIVGEEDAIATVAQVKQLQSLYCNSRLWIVSEATHLRTISAAPERYKQELRDFMDSV